MIFRSKWSMQREIEYLKNEKLSMQSALGRANDRIDVLESRLRQESNYLQREKETASNWKSEFDKLSLARKELLEDLTAALYKAKASDSLMHLILNNPKVKTFVKEKIIRENQEEQEGTCS